MDKILTRKCPSCNINLYYTTEKIRKVMDRKQSKCNSCARKGRKNTIEMRMLMSMNHPKPWLGKKHSEESKLRMKHTKSDDTRRKLRESTIAYIEKCNGQISPRYNQNACKLFDEINKEMNWNGIHAENGGEYRILGYFVDYYEPVKNIVIEYDEDHHSQQRERDIIRQYEIIQELNCKFYRIPSDLESQWKQIIQSGT